MSAIQWMQEGPFGVMVHYTYGIYPRQGGMYRDWQKMVDQFPVEEFCEAIASAGAKWLMFPYNHSHSKDYWCCSPNAVVERLLPGRCAKRDLMREIGENLQRRGIRLLAYVSSNVASRIPLVQDALKWKHGDWNLEEFQRIYMDVIRYWSESMGPLLSGWFFDGCYDVRRSTGWWIDAYFHHHEIPGVWNAGQRLDNSRFDKNEWIRAVRAGNPNSVFTMHVGPAPSYLWPEQDYVAGEIWDLEPPCTEPLVDGLVQWHVNTYLDCKWMHARPGLIEPPRFSTNQLFEYVNDCHKHGGGVTLNVGIYADGTLAAPSITQLQDVHWLMKQAGTVSQSTRGKGG